MYIYSLKFWQRMLLHCSCQHCCVPQAAHRIWLHSAARFSLLMEKYHSDRVPIGRKDKKGNRSLLFLCSYGWFGMSMTLTRLKVQSHRSGAHGTHEPLLHPALPCALVLQEASRQDLLCLNFLWKPTDRGKPTRNGSKANPCLFSCFTAQYLLDNVHKAPYHELQGQGQLWEHMNFHSCFTAMLRTTCPGYVVSSLADREQTESHESFSLSLALDRLPSVTTKVSTGPSLGGAAVSTLSFGVCTPDFPDADDALWGWPRTEARKNWRINKGIY